MNPLDFDETTPCKMLRAGIDLYLATRRTPMETHARSVLDAIMSIHAEELGADDCDESTPEGCAVAILGYLRPVFEELGDHYSEPGFYECEGRTNATLCSIPVVIRSEDDPKELDRPTVDTIKQAMRSRELITDAVSVQMLGLLTCEPVHQVNLFDRRRLLELMTHAFREESFVVKVTKPGAPIIVPFERLMARTKQQMYDTRAGVKGTQVCGTTLHLRFINFALISGTVDTRELAEKLHNDQKLSARMNAWLGDLQQAVIHHGNYSRVTAAQAPTVLRLAADAGQVLFGTCQAEDFIEKITNLSPDPYKWHLKIGVVADDDGLPAEVDMQIMDEADIDQGQTTIYLDECRGESLLHVTRKVVTAAFQAGADIGLGEITVQGIDLDLPGD